MMLSTVNLNSLKENSGPSSSMKKNVITSTSTTTTSLQPGSLSHLKQKLYTSSSSSLSNERKALGEITNTTSKSNLMNGKKSLNLTTSTSDNKLLFVPTSNTPQIRKKSTSTLQLPIFNSNVSTSVISKPKKPTIVNSNNSPIHNNNTVHSAPSAPLRLSSELSNHSIESLIMTPSYDLPLSGYTESFEDNIYRIEQQEYNYNSNGIDDPSLMIEDNFSFSDYYQDNIIDDMIV